MFLLTRPPLARPLAAALLVVAALWADLRPPSLVMHPFVAVDVAAGELVDHGMVTMRPVPPGTFTAIQLPVQVHRGLAAGDPVSTGEAPEESKAEVPNGWLTLELAVPTGAAPGDRVVVVVSHHDQAPTSISGVVVAVGLDDGFGGEVAACAFPPDDAPAVAVAASEQRASVLVGG